MTTSTSAAEATAAERSKKLLRCSCFGGTCFPHLIQQAQRGTPVSGQRETGRRNFVGKTKIVPPSKKVYRLHNALAFAEKQFQRSLN